MTGPYIPGSNVPVAAAAAQQAAQPPVQFIARRRVSRRAAQRLSQLQISAIVSGVKRALRKALDLFANFGVLSGRRRLDFDEQPTRREPYRYDGHDDL